LWKVKCCFGFLILYGIFDGIFEGVGPMFKRIFEGVGPMFKRRMQEMDEAVCVADKDKVRLAQKSAKRIDRFSMCGLSIAK
jgi:hypothetical protein